MLGYLIYGVGMYATPSTDTAVTTAPEDKVGVASGVYKMASSLGNSFGVAISGTIFTIMSARDNIHVGAMYGLWFNAALAIIAFVFVWLLVPKSNLIISYGNKIFEVNNKMKCILYARLSIKHRTVHFRVVYMKKLGYRQTSYA